MNNTFNWQGKASIFTVGKGATAFNGVNSRRSTLASDTAVANTISMPNSSIFLPPGKQGPQRTAHARPRKSV